MAGPRWPHQHHGCHGVAYDVAVTSRAEIIRHAVRLARSCRRPASNHTSLSCGPAPLHPCIVLIRKVAFIHQCRQEAGRTEIFA
jgi:hypothetical protein